MAVAPTPGGRATLDSFGAQAQARRRTAVLVVSFALPYKFVEWVKDDHVTLIAKNGGGRRWILKESSFAPYRKTRPGWRL